MTLNDPIGSIRPNHPSPADHTASADHTAPTDRAARLARRSWKMLLFLLVSFPAAFALGTFLMNRLGVPEGGLLSTAGTAGWLAALLVLLVEVSPLIAGTVCGVRAARADRAVLAAGPARGKRSRLPLWVNAGLLAWLTAVQLTQLALA